MLQQSAANLGREFDALISADDFEVEMPHVNVLTFRDETVARIDSFADRVSALEAAGLSE